MNDPPTGASLSRVVRVSIKRPGLTIGVCLTLALAGLVVTARHLTFQTSSVELLPRITSTSSASRSTSAISASSTIS